MWEHDVVMINGLPAECPENGKDCTNSEYVISFGGAKSLSGHSGVMGCVYEPHLGYRCTVCGKQWEV